MYGTRHQPGGLAASTSASSSRSSASPVPGTPTKATSSARARRTPARSCGTTPTWPTRSRRRSRRRWASGPISMPKPTARPRCLRRSTSERRALPAGGRSASTGPGRPRQCCITQDRIRPERGRTGRRPARRPRVGGPHDLSAPAHHQPADPRPARRCAVPARCPGRGGRHGCSTDSSEVGLIDDATFARAWVSSRHHGRGLAGRAPQRRASAARRRCRDDRRGRRRPRPGHRGADRAGARPASAGLGRRCPPRPGRPTAAAAGVARPQGLSRRAGLPRGPGGADGPWQSDRGSRRRWRARHDRRARHHPPRRSVVIKGLSVRTRLDPPQGRI